MDIYTKEQSLLLRSKPSRTPASRKQFNALQVELAELRDRIIKLEKLLAKSESKTVKKGVKNA